MMRTIVTWTWHGERQYGPEHIAKLYEMLRRHMAVPFRLVAFCEDPQPVDGVEVFGIPKEAQRVAAVRTIESHNFPSSFRRLWLFSRDAAAFFLGGRILLVDVDVVVTSDWSHLWDAHPDAPFVGWRPGMLWGSSEIRVGGGVWMHRTGTRPEVWEDFLADPERAKLDARQAGFRGSDQAWISYRLAAGAPVWDGRDGIESVRDYTRDRHDRVVETIPDHTCMVHFNGHGKPWHPRTWEQHPWLADYWPGGQPGA